MRHLALPTLLLALVGCSTDETSESGEPGPTRQAVAVDALLPSGCGHAHNDYFSWPGMGAMPAPDTEAAWAAQLDAGYDLVNTDDLAGFSTYLATR